MYEECWLSIVSRQCTYARSPLKSKANRNLLVYASTSFFLPFPNFYPVRQRVVDSLGHVVVFTFCPPAAREIMSPMDIGDSDWWDITYELRRVCRLRAGYSEHLSLGPPTLYFSKTQRMTLTGCTKKAYRFSSWYDKPEAHDRELSFHQLGPSQHASNFSSLIGWYRSIIWSIVLCIL